ncbi:MAG: 16S rRNA (guanine(966)-N(2))-methyltransferase RsmD [Mycoplasma sp.]|nr:16S rRNA (guanine(966)-N(2))-methyltransferase RsmD [Mycoplasma sp.]
MRIISGKYRNRKINYPPAEIARPTIDRIRESIFSILHNKVEGALVVDLFSGSGSMGIEAISRGATKGYFIDINPKSIKIINENVSELGITNCEIFRGSYETFLRTKRGSKFDLFFLDPPFDESELYFDALKKIEENDLLKQNGLIIIEKSVNTSISIPKSFTIQREKTYGTIHILILSNI